jgi:hypothetical protein
MSEKKINAKKNKPVKNTNYSNIYNYEETSPELSGIISDLRLSVDLLDEKKETVRFLIQELGTRLDKNKICKANEIGRKIKEILKDKIKDRKISERWIEKCLPDEYKREYVKKENELSSLSKKKKTTPLLVTDNSGKSFAITQEGNTPTNPLDKKDPLYHSDKEESTDIEFSNVDLIRKIKELEEALEKATTFQSAYNLIKEIQFPKGKIEELIIALKKCKAVVFIRFDAKGIIQSIKPDTLRDQQFENVNDTSNDDYTY